MHAGIYCSESGLLLKHDSEACSGACRPAWRYNTLDLLLLHFLDQVTDVCLPYLPILEDSLENCHEPDYLRVHVTCKG